MGEIVRRKAGKTAGKIIKMAFNKNLRRLRIKKGIRRKISVQILDLVCQYIKAILEFMPS